jgi:DNA mismatch repair protein MutL
VAFSPDRGWAGSGTSTAWLWYLYRGEGEEQLLNDLLSLMACHAAVRAGDRLTLEEIAALLQQRELAQDSRHCPQGRPTSLLFTLAELGKQFRRT